MLTSAHWRVCDRCLGTIAVARGNLMGVNCDSILESLEQRLLGTGVHVLSGKPRDIYLSHFLIPPPSTSCGPGYFELLNPLPSPSSGI